MKTLKTAIIFILLTSSVYGQYDYSFNMEAGTNLKTKAVEFRGMYENWYLGLQVENVRTDREFFGFGANLGAFNKLDRFTFLYGVRVGHLSSKKGSKMLYGLNTEIDYSLSDLIFAGLKLEYAAYSNGIENDQIRTVSVPRVALKIGLKL